MDFETHISLADHKTQISTRILYEVLFSLSSLQTRAGDLYTNTEHDHKNVKQDL